MAVGRSAHTAEDNCSELEMERFCDEELHTIPAIEAKTALTSESSADPSVVTCCFQRIRFQWDWKRWILLLFLSYGIGVGSGAFLFSGNDEAAPDVRSSSTNQNPKDKKDPAHKSTSLDGIDEAHGSVPATIDGDEDDNDDLEQLMLVNETFFQDKMCQEGSYRLDTSPSQLDGPIILWAHTFSPGNAPSDPPGPFDAKAPQPNMVHVALNLESRLKEKLDSSSIVLVLSTYSLTSWTVDLQEYASKVSKIIATGFFPSTITILNENVQEDVPTPEQEVFFFVQGGDKMPMPGWELYYPPSPIMRANGYEDLNPYKKALEDYTGGQLYWYGYCDTGSDIVFHLDLYRS